MPAIQHLLQRWGFVRLGRFGLELTPDGRILSNRPAVLDDGAGGRVVGWRDDDRAISELRSWQPTVNHVAPIAVREVGRVVIPPLPPARRAVPLEPMSVIPSISHGPSAPSAAVMPVAVAVEPVVDEDDWEWTIALARARTAAGRAEPVRPPPPPAATLRTRPMATVAMKDQAPVPRAASSAGATWVAPTPSTVIPVPSLPAVQGFARLEPVVRTAAESAAPRRFPKGTSPGPSTSLGMTAMSEDTVPNLSIGDQTRPGTAPASALSTGDRTRPDLALPAAARAVALASVKRRTASRG